MVPVLLLVLLVGRRSAAVGSVRQGAQQRRSPRERAPGRGAQDVRARHRAPRRGQRGAADADALLDARSAMPRRMGRPRRQDAADPAASSRDRTPARRARPRSGWPRSSRSSTPRCCASAPAPTGASATRWVSTAARWFDAVARTLAAPIETPDYPGRKFIVQCADIARAVATLARGERPDARRARVARHRVVERAMTHWRPEQYRRDLGAAGRARQSVERPAGLRLHGLLRAGCRRPMPEYFVAGCAASPTQSVQAARDARRGRDRPSAARAGARLPTTRAPDMPRGRRALERAALARRDAAAARDAATADGLALSAVHRRARPRRTDADELSLRSEPHRHRRHADRRRLSDRPHDRSRGAGARAEDRGLLHRPPGRLHARSGSRAARTPGSAIGHRMLERAVVRMAAIAVIDVASGRIEALAGALSPCTRRNTTGPGRAKTCDKRLPYPIRYRPDALLNPAVYHDAMPASVIKPIMAAAFLSDPDVGARWLAAEQAAMQRPGSPSPDSLRGQLMRSNSARFLDRMFCADQAFAELPRGRGTSRRWRSPSAGTAAAPTRASDCGKRDLLFGRAVDASDESGTVAPLATLVPYGRLLRRAGRRQARRAVPVASPRRRSTSARCSACAAGAGRPALQQRRLGEMHAAASSSTSSPRAGDRAMRGRARSASPA